MGTIRQNFSPCDIGLSTGGIIFRSCCYLQDELYAEEEREVKAFFPFLAHSCITQVNGRLATAHASRTSCLQQTTLLPRMALKPRHQRSCPQSLIPGSKITVLDR